MFAKGDFRDRTDDIVIQQDEPGIEKTLSRSFALSVNVFLKIFCLSS